MLERTFVRPGRPVHALRDERVVDVADREDADVQRDRIARDGARIARSVEPLVMAADEPVHRVGEASELP